MKKVDMSEKMISMRLRRVDQLRELSLSLMRAKREYDLQQAKLRDKEKKANENDN
jgi:hypothetical protein